MLLNTNICYGLVRTSMFTNACIFLGSNNFWSFETTNPKIIPKNTMKMHFQGLSWYHIPCIGAWVGDLV